MSGPSTAAAKGVAATMMGGDGALPPLHVPLRFFATAAVFLVASGVAVAVWGPVVFEQRWSAPALAVTHLLTLGFFTMVMLGALFQVVPVIGGRPIPAATVVATVTHLALTAGTVALAHGLATGSVPTLQLALVALLTALGAFVPAAIVGVTRRSRALVPVRLAGLAFLGTVALGAVMVTGTAYPELGIAVRERTDLHAAFGFLGWALLLIVGVGYQVVPMFHVTPPVPRFAERVTVPALATGLVALALPAPLPTVGVTVVGVFGAAHCIVMMGLLRRRRRRRPDATVLAWQVGLVAMAAALVLQVLEASPLDILRPHRWLPRAEAFTALLFALTGLATVVVGMLTKIVPFLAFVHLQRHALVVGRSAPLPLMEDLLAASTARAIVFVHTVAASLSLAAVVAPPLSRAAGIGLALDGIALGTALVAATRRALRADRALGTT
jgi:hypothetical protein